MAREEAPGMIPGTSQKDDLLDLQTPTKIDPEIGEGALLLGMIAAGDAGRTFCPDLIVFVFFDNDCGILLNFEILSRILLFEYGFL